MTNEKVTWARKELAKQLKGVSSKTERTILRMNGKKELEFMSDDRKKMIDNQGELANYLDQFEKIEGISKIWQRITGIPAIELIAESSERIKNTGI